MQNVATYPRLQSGPFTAKRNGLLTYVRGFSLVVWMLCLQLPFWWVADWTFWRSADGPNFHNYYYVGFAVCLCAHLTLGLNAWIRGTFGLLSMWPGRLVAVFCAIALALSPLSLAPSTTARYAVATWGVYLLTYLFWQADYRVTRKMIVLTGVVLFAWQGVLAIKHGVNVGVSIGGILRNYTGQAGLTAMVCCMMSAKRHMQWSGIAVALFLALLVNSRGTLVAMAAFLIVYYAVFNGSYRFILFGSIAAAATIALFLIWPDLWNHLSTRVFALHDKDRGLGSGFTGRWDLLMDGINSFWKTPVFGCGFRSAFEVGRSASHSGIIRLFVETGFVGGFLILGAIFIEMKRRFFLVQRIRDLPALALPEIDILETTRINSIAFAMYCMSLTLWVYEPVYINLGAVSSLLFWVMMVAPTYITKQGVPIQR